MTPKPLRGERLARAVGIQKDFKRLFKEARKSPTYWREMLNLMKERMLSDRRWFKAQIREIAKLTAGNSQTEPTVNERCILNICEQINRVID